MNKKKTSSKFFKPIAFIVIAGIIAFVIVRYRQFLTLEYVQSQLVALQEQISNNLMQSVLIYFVVYVISTAISIPGATVLTLLGGALFGTAIGIVSISFASTIGATIAFLLGRFLFRGYLEKKFPTQLQKINNGVRKDGANYLFALRLVPVFPFFVINLLMGLTRITALKFMFVSQLGMLAGTVVYVNAGQAISTIQSLSDIVQPQIWIAFALIATLPFISKFITNAFQKRRLYKKFKKPSHFDTHIAVIGAGSGGLVASYIAASIKAKPILIEKAEMGGDCLNRGCVPSKAILSLSKLADLHNEAKDVGIRYNKPTVSFPDVMDAVHDAIKEVAPHDSVERYSKLGVECVQGTATILSPWEIEVNGRTIRAKNIILATGGVPRTLDIPGSESVTQYTSDTIWELRTLPTNLVVVGGGPIGSELALAFSRLGSKVTVIQSKDYLLPNEDAEVGAIARKILESHNVEVITGAKTESIVSSGKTAMHISLSDGTTRDIAFSHLLVAAGRKAATDTLKTGPLSFEYNENGTLRTDEYLQTCYPNVFAVGDLTGPYQFTHIAGHMGWYAVVNALFGSLKKFAIDYNNVPAVTYLSPEIARIGLNEKEAKAKNIPYEVVMYEMKELDRAIAERKTEGFIKVLTKPNKDCILGATIVAERGGEILGEFLLAKKHNIGLKKILGTIHPYPTFTEAVKSTAGIWAKAHAPTKILNFLEKHFEKKLR